MVEALRKLNAWTDQRRKEEHDDFQRLKQKYKRTTRLYRLLWVRHSSCKFFQSLQGLKIALKDASTAMQKAKKKNGKLSHRFVSNSTLEEAKETRERAEETLESLHRAVNTFMTTAREISGKNVLSEVRLTLIERDWKRATREIEKAAKGEVQFGEGLWKEEGKAPLYVRALLRRRDVVLVPTEDSHEAFLDEAKEEEEEEEEDDGESAALEAALKAVLEEESGGKEEEEEENKGEGEADADEMAPLLAVPAATAAMGAAAMAEGEGEGEIGVAGRGDVLNLRLVPLSELPEEEVGWFEAADLPATVVPGGDCAWVLRGKREEKARGLFVNMSADMLKETLHLLLARIRLGVHDFPERSLPRNRVLEILQDISGTDWRREELISPSILYKAPSEIDDNRAARIITEFAQRSKSLPPGFLPVRLSAALSSMSQEDEDDSDKDEDESQVRSTLLPLHPRAEGEREERQRETETRPTALLPGTPFPCVSGLCPRVARQLVPPASQCSSAKRTRTERDAEGSHTVAGGVTEGSAKRSREDQDVVTAFAGGMQTSRTLTDQAGTETGTTHAATFQALSVDAAATGGEAPEAPVGGALE
eukprot:Cvel_22341.t2-p1 / transcript=Cvel_22341.t2 / gene=Cvel_22341 / organism=Chromera_velia_CCMP2878 / gene_product=hypothetical protein / transcript_product=hypothetical protein / location=Cvel_scaffold2186:25475-32079(+) / protein_length=592 / sequence_SO=supercontig / SO=protein_coding / is_pseudo=false